MKKEYLEKSYWNGKIIDVHTHFFPEQMFRAIWKYFESFNWQIYYKDTPEKLAETLRGLGVRRHTLLNYAHKSGVAKSLNAWTAEFASRVEAAMPFFTMHPEDAGNKAEARRMLENGFYGLKVQPLVQNYHVNDKRMTPVYEELLRAGAWLIVHAGTAPYANDYVGAKYFRELLKDFPDINVIVAHMGAYEFDDFFELLEKHPNMRLDTTMVFTKTHVFDTSFPEKKHADLIRFSDRILFGSDFPNIPYPYEESVNGLLRLEFEESFYEKVFFKNALVLVPKTINKTR